jgi:hypothetical protein
VSDDLAPVGNFLRVANPRQVTFMGHTFMAPADVADYLERILECATIEGRPDPDTDPRPRLCSRRLRDEGKVYPRSGCEVSGCTMFSRRCHEGFSDLDAIIDTLEEATIKLKDLRA